MAELSYALRAEQLLETLLEQFEAVEALEDLDMDLIDGVLTVVFEDGAQLIINRQEPVEQIWLASPLGPAHFDFDAERQQWVNDRDGDTLHQTLEQAFGQKLGIRVELEGGF